MNRRDTRLKRSKWALLRMALLKQCFAKVSNAVSVDTLQCLIDLLYRADYVPPTGRTKKRRARSLVSLERRMYQ